MHSHDPFEPNSGLTIIKGDIYDDLAVNHALEGSHAVISTLGSWGTKTKDVVSKGTENIVAGMQNQGLNRLITLTGSGAAWVSDKPSFNGRIGRGLLKIVAPKILSDGERHLELLEASSLEWTCVRSPGMKDGKSAAYVLSLRQPPVWKRVTRTAVAECMVDLAVTREYGRQAPIIS